MYTGRFVIVENYLLPFAISRCATFLLNTTPTAAVACIMHNIFHEDELEKPASSANNHYCDLYDS